MPHHDAPPNSAQVGNLEHHTIAYSMAAAAAGVSLMALAAPAEGKVVITTHINIPVTSTVSLDLNHDGVADIQIGYAATRRKLRLQFEISNWLLLVEPFSEGPAWRRNSRFKTNWCFKSCQERADREVRKLRTVRIHGPEGGLGIFNRNPCRQLGQRPTKSVSGLRL